MIPFVLRLQLVVYPGNPIPVLRDDVLGLRPHVQLHFLWHEVTIINNRIQNNMLLPYLPILNKKKVILGSQSKTRNELMKSQVSHGLL